MAKMFDSDASPQDAGFNALRIGIAMVAEYASVAIPNTRLAWAVQDVRSAVLDLVESLMTDERSRITKDTRDLMKFVRETFGDV